MIAGFALAPVSRSVTAEMLSDALMQVVADDMSFAARSSLSMTDEQRKTYVSSAEGFGAGRLRQVFYIAACASKCFAETSSAVFHPLTNTSSQLARSSWILSGSRHR